MAVVKDNVTTRVADSLTSTVSEMAPRVAKSLLGAGLSKYQEMPMKDVLEVASRRWADPAFRAKLLQAIGNERFLDIGKRLGYWEKPPVTPEQMLANKPPELQ